MERERSKMSEWANIQYEGNNVGTLYLDGERFGFVPVVQSSEAVKGFGVVSDLIKAALIASSLTAEDSYFGILGSLDKRDGFSYESGSGESIPKPERDTTGLTQYAMESQPSQFYVRLNEDDEVVNFVWDSVNGMYVREGGEWVEATPENWPDDDDYFLQYVTENSVTTYDKLVTSNKAPTIDDLEVVAPSDE